MLLRYLSTGLRKRCRSEFVRCMASVRGYRGGRGLGDSSRGREEPGFEGRSY